MSSSKVSQCSWTTFKPSWSSLVSTALEFGRPDERYHECVSAEFGSNFPETPARHQLVLAEPLDLCSPSAGSLQSRGVLATRGGCSFELKAKHAMESGASLLVVFDADNDPMPMGGAFCGGHNFFAAMIGPSQAASELFQSLQRKERVRYTLAAENTFENEHDKSSSTGQVNLMATAVTFFAGLVSSAWALARPSESSSLTASVGVAMVLTSLTTFRATTSLRTLNVGNGASVAGAQGGGPIFDHRETDEVVLRFLAEAVRDHGFGMGYSLTVK